MTLQRVKTAIVLWLGFLLAWQGVFAISAGTVASGRSAKSACCCTGCDSRHCARPACCAKPADNRPPNPAASPRSTSQNELQALASSLVLFATLPSDPADEPCSAAFA